MKRTLTATLLLALVASIFAGAGPASAQKVGYFYDFQKGTAPWIGRMSVGEKLMDLSLGTQTNPKTGNTCATLTLPGVDAGWMQIALAPNANTLHLEFDVANISGGERLAPIVYVGGSDPRFLYDFQLLGLPLEKGAQHLQYDASLKGIAYSGRAIPVVVVAVGFMNLDFVQAKMAASIDNVAVTMYDK